MNWIFLIIGGFFEIGFASCLGKANQESGWTHWLWLGGFLISLSFSMFLLYKATSGLHAIPIGTAYAVWTGIGAVGTALMGILFFKEPASLWRLFFIFTLIGSIVGLRIVSNR